MPLPSALQNPNSKDSTKTRYRLLGETVLSVLESNREGGDGNTEGNHADKSTGNQSLVVWALEHTVHVVSVVIVTMATTLLSAGRRNEATRGSAVGLLVV